MKNTTAYILFPLLFFILWIGFYQLNQNAAVWENGLGIFTDNYENNSTAENPYNISRNDKPYREPNNENVIHWDAPFYKEIAESGYKNEGAHKEYKAAFFPLFPYLWRLTNLPPQFIGYFNYFVFAISLFVLALLYKPSVFSYCTAFFIPTVVVYFLPYSEAAFIFAVAIAVAGSFRNNYWLFFLGMFLIGLSRSAAIFFPFLIIALSILDVIKGRNFKAVFIESFKQFLPLILGIATTLFIQFIENRDPTALFKAQSHWQRSLGLPVSFTDWSAEGFSMTSTGIWFVCVPALFYFLYELVYTAPINEKISFFTNENYPKYRFWFRFSLSYLSFIFVYKILLEQGSLHSLSRYLWASPFFYIVFFTLSKNNNFTTTRTINKIFLFSFIALIVWMILVQYGRPHFSFSWAGMWLGVLVLLFNANQKNITPKIKWVVFTVLLLLALCWQTFLYNMFLCNAWIYT